MSKIQNLRIAIHHRSGSFSDRWIEYCEQNSIIYSLIDCYQSDIVLKLRDYDILLWHWHHEDTKAILFARQLLRSLEQMGLKVFPNIDTCWYFDDKVGQKYFLEAINAPLTPSYVFYDKAEALSWIEKTDFPKVFKLRGGAGSTNVKLVRNRDEATKICHKAFGKGFRPVAGYFTDISTKMRNTRSIKDYYAKIQRMPALIIKKYLANSGRSREKGYLYFQDFIPNNTFDTRVVIIGNRAFAFRRFVRKNDFRASASGQADLDPSKINVRCISIAFEVAQKLKCQSVAFDFIEDEKGNPLLIEMSYGFTPGGYIKDCPGHWDKDYNWHKGKMWAQDAIIEDMIEDMQTR